MASPAISVRAGTLLIAPPMSDDPNFQRTVVLVCEHSDSGSFGLILNRELTLHMDDVLEDLASYSAPLSLGGPVQQNTLHYLHRFGDIVPGSVMLVDGTFWGGDFDAVKSLVRIGQGAARDLRFFLGYSGWGAGQLEEEIEQGGWILAEGEESFIFPEDQSKLWRAVLRDMGGEYAALANYPDDPRLN
jgi:putative transcriptional regulator